MHSMLQGLQQSPRPTITQNENKALRTQKRDQDQNDSQGHSAREEDDIRYRKLLTL